MSDPAELSVDTPIHVRLYVEPNEAYYSQLRCGLIELREQGKLQLSWSAKPTPDTFAPPADQWRPMFTTRLVINPDTPQALNVCFDMDDGESMHPEYLTWSDVYFKRGYTDEAVADLESSQRSKVLPFGLQLACRSPEESLLDSLQAEWASKQGEFAPYGTAKALLRRYLRSQNLSPLSTALESEPTTPVEQRVFFRTRVYAPQDARGADGQGTLRRINDLRAGVVRALKEAFGTQFIGGLRPSRYALDHYPDCVVDDSFDFAEHLRQTKINLINVNTDGLHNSTGWKLAEMLAAATCVVAERPKHKLPVPLTEGLHYQAFTTPEECVAACRTLLADAELANNMRHANYAYYRHQVRPDSLIERCLVEALLKGEEFTPAKQRTKAA